MRVGGGMPRVHSTRRPTRLCYAPPMTAPAVQPASIVRLPHQWFVACRSRDLGMKPLACTIQNKPLALFRDAAGRPAALLDRCPHRNAPLSAGRRQDGLLECGYHGWRFDGSGACRAVPGLAGPTGREGRAATAFAATEQDGFVWVYSTPDAAPVREPYRFPLLDDPRYTTIRRAVTMPGPLWHALENALDVPHTAYLHGGLFRTSKPRGEIDVTVRRADDVAEAIYEGEPRPSGLIGRLLAPQGGVVEHTDRFLLPSIAQVEYRLGPDNHLLVSAAMTPVDDFTTRHWAVVSLRVRALPARLLGVVATPLVARILRQDATMLGRQSEVIRRFGGEAFASTALDVLGPQIWTLLEHAARGETAPGAHEHRVRMRV
jgi:phenylpropionate dioxygenase-like ring-hydroxylating dioxygenase large terminal subunit